MALFDTITSDPKKLQVISDFLMGFGQGIGQANRGGTSPLIALSAGFGQGGAQVQQAQYLRQQKELRDAQVEANRAKLAEQERATRTQQYLRAIAENPALSRSQKAEMLRPFSGTVEGSRLYKAYDQEADKSSEFERLVASLPDDEADALRKSRAYKLAQDEDGGWGNSLTGLSLSALSAEREFKAAGQPVPDDVARDAAIARHVLQQPRVTKDANGNLVEIIPGIPAVFESDPTPQQPPADADGQTTPGGSTIATVDVKKEKVDVGRIENVEAALGDAADLLNEAAQSGETIVGVPGAAKAQLGGIARQMGIPMSDKSRQLQTALDVIRSVVTPIIMNEKRLSNQEREQVREIVGSLDWKTDEVELRNKLVYIAKFLERVKTNE